MTITIAPELLAGFFFALVRTSAWITVTPPFSSNAISFRVKIAIAAAISFNLAPKLGNHPEAFEFWNFVAGIVYQAVVGLALGFLVLLLFSAVQVAGELLDFFAGFSAASVYNPLSNNYATPLGRVYQLLATMILFAINGHLILVRGFMSSFAAAPLSGLRLNQLGDVFTRDILAFVVSAIEIASPLLAALFLTEILLGLLARSAPQMNVLVFGFTLKILLVLLLVGLALPILPDAVSNLLDKIMTHSAALVGG